MESNFRLNLFLITFKRNREVEENYFQYKSLIQTFCEKYQPCQQILYEYSNKKKLSSNPDIYTIFKKLNYENWEKKPAEEFYFLPLLDSLNKMKANLLKLYSLGQNFWKQPLAEND